MDSNIAPSQLAAAIGCIPYRLALAGGWIDQPYVSRFNPSPPGSMVVVAVQPTFRFMDRSGMSTSTRQIARRLWDNQLPGRDPSELVRELYAKENEGKPQPSGSQDMIGLVYPGINRLDYDFTVEGGVFPAHIECLRDAGIAAWLESIIRILPVASRPEGYNPLEETHFDPDWIRRLGQSGKDCFEAIRQRHVTDLGASMNECMNCWEAILPNTVRHPSLAVDLVGLLRAYQSEYAGAMYSGCGGGYLYVVSETPVPGSFQVKIRLD